MEVNEESSWKVSTTLSKLQQTRATAPVSLGEEMRGACEWDCTNAFV